MNTESIINSIYKPKRKSKDIVVLPKILKGQSAQPETIAFPRPNSRKYHNIFKIDHTQDNNQEKKQKLRLPLEEERLRAKEYDQLEVKMADMMRKHQEELRQIEQSEKQLNAKIGSAKQQHYHIKLNIWELKNQIMDLNAIFHEEEAENKRLQELVPQQEQEEALLPNQDEQLLYVNEQGQPEKEEEMEDSNMKILHSFSQQNCPDSIQP